MTAVAKLLPCPFCGGEPDVLVIERHTHGPIAGFMPDYDDGQFIECGCGIAMAIAPDKDAAEAWNRRAALSPAELGGAEATVCVDAKPGFRHVIDVPPNVSLPVGTKLFTRKESS